MNDEKLKKLLNQDMSTPVEPSNQWSHILNKIESRKKMSLRWLIPASTLASVLTILLISTNSIKPKPKTTLDQELIEFYLDDFYGEEEIYSWVEAE